jgi:hypothetical protein
MVKRWFSAGTTIFMEGRSPAESSRRLSLEEKEAKEHDAVGEVHRGFTEDLNACKKELTTVLSNRLSALIAIAMPSGTGERAGTDRARINPAAVEWVEWEAARPNDDACNCEGGTQSKAAPTLGGGRHGSSSAFRETWQNLEVEVMQVLDELSTRHLSSHRRSVQNAKNLTTMRLSTARTASLESARSQQVEMEAAKKDQARRLRQELEAEHAARVEELVNEAKAARLQKEMALAKMQAEAAEKERLASEVPAPATAPQLPTRPGGVTSRRRVSQDGC